LLLQGFGQVTAYGVIVEGEKRYHQSNNEYCYKFIVTAHALFSMLKTKVYSTQNLVSAPDTKLAGIY
jgi:hypothetical protein